MERPNMESAPVEQDAAKKEVKKTSFFKRGAKIAATLLVGANLDKVPVPSFDTPLNENNNRPVSETVENTLSETEKEKEIIANKLASISKNPDLQYYKDHINDVNPDIIEKLQSQGAEAETIDTERYKRGLMVRVVEILLRGKVNVNATDKIEISVYKGVPYSIRYETAQIGFDVYQHDLSFPEYVTGSSPKIDTDTTNRSIVTVSGQVIADAFADFYSN